MKFIMSILLMGVIVLSCKKENRTETSVTTDSVISDTMRTDTVSNVTPMAPVPADTMRTDTISTKKHADTARTSNNKSPRK